MDNIEKILIVEDDEDINNLLKSFLEEAGYEVSQAFSGTEAKFFNADDFNLLVLDLMLPGRTGEEIISDFRRKSNIPILVISGKSSLEDKVNALDLGADDYIIKPFEKLEVIARVNVLLRRLNLLNDTVAESISHRIINVNPKTMIVSINDKEIDLTQTEYLILYEMMKEPGVVFSRDKLYELIWGEDYFESDNAITVHVSHLRQKLRKATGEELISTVWGVGYKLNK